MSIVSRIHIWKPKLEHITFKENPGIPAKYSDRPIEAVSAIAKNTQKLQGPLGFQAQIKHEL